MKIISRIFMTIFLGLGLALLALLAARGQAIAASDSSQVGILYVATTGSDTSDCSDSANPCATVQYAVDQATSEDEIRVAGGVYTDIHPRPRRDITTTGLVTQVIYISTSVKIQGGYSLENWTTSAPEENPTVINPQGKGRGVYITGLISPTLSGLQVTRGNVIEGGQYGYTDTEKGGGLFAITATLTLQDCQIFSNTAKLGGALYLLNAQTTLSGNQIYSNTTVFYGNIYFDHSVSIIKGNDIFMNSSDYGGGIYADASELALYSNQIISNSAEASGGGLYSSGGAVTLQENVFSHNEAANGGGAYLKNGDVTFLLNEVRANHGTHDGGGLYLGAGSHTILSNTFMLNTADRWGGSISLQNGAAELIGNQVSDSSAGEWGGGISLYSGAGTLERNILTFNTASNGGGLHSLNTHVSMTGNQFLTNTASTSGGGMFFQSGNNSTFLDNLFLGNIAGNGGGGVNFQFCGSQTLKYNSFIRNFSGSYGGGGSFGSCKIILEDNSFWENTAYSGGGFSMGANAGTSILRNSIMYNVALASSSADTGHGGGIAISGGALLDTNRIMYNTADQIAGGIYISGDQITLVNNVIADNQAGGDGAGVYIFDHHPTLLHNTIARNQGTTGIYAESVHYLGYIILMLDNIIVGHTVGLHVGENARVDINGTLWGADEWGNGVDWEGEGTYLIGPVNVWGPPNFIDPNAGDFHISLESAAIDAGIEAGVRTDMDDEARPARLTFDLGADEYVDHDLLTVKQVSAAQVLAGSPVTYTLFVTNTSLSTLHVTITDVLPLEGLPTGLLTWTAILAAGEGWSQTLNFTSAEDYFGEIINQIFVASEEGATGASQVSFLSLAPVPLCQVRLNDAPEIYGSIQEAIEVSSSPGDVIKIQGTCDQLNTLGGLSQIVYLTKTVTLQGGWNSDFSVRDVNNYPTILDAHGGGRGIYALGNITVTLDGLQITGGDSTGLGGATNFFEAGSGIYMEHVHGVFQEIVVHNNYSPYIGGGLFVNQGNIQLINSQVISNTSDWSAAGMYINASDGLSQIVTSTISGNECIHTGTYGGAVWAYQSHLLIRHNQIRNNLAGKGGAMYVSGGNVAVEENTFEENVSYQKGGAIFIYGPTTVLSNTFQANTSFGEGGALFIYLGASAWIQNNLIAENHAGLDGGAIYWESGNPTMVLKNNVIRANSAAHDGGGLYLRYTNAQLINNVLADNQAGWSGGAIFVYLSSPDLYHTTFANNQSGNGTGIYIPNIGYPGSHLDLFNTIIVDHTIGIFVGFGNSADLQGNLWGSGVWANGTDWQGGGVIITNTVNLWGDPDFIAPSLGDYHLGPNSTALDAGIDAGITTDIDGDARPLWLGFDIGADEFNTPFSPAGLVELQGRTDHSGAIVTAWSGETIVATTTTTLSGTYALSVPDGVYKITIEMPRYLDAVKYNVYLSNTSVTSLAPVTLKGGDVNDNDTINILDIAVIGAHYDQTCPDPNWEPRADINGDCEINLLDLVLAAANFGKSSPVLWE